MRTMGNCVWSHLVQFVKLLQVSQSSGCHIWLSGTPALGSRNYRMVCKRYFGCAERSIRGRQQQGSCARIRVAEFCPGVMCAGVAGFQESCCSAHGPQIHVMIHFLLKVNRRFVRSAEYGRNFTVLHRCKGVLALMRGPGWGLGWLEGGAHDT